MTRSNALFAMVAAAALLPAASFGQPAPVPSPAPNERADTMVFVGSGAPIVPFAGRIDVLRSQGSVLGKVVKGKPYSADSVTESTQILADGNRITSRNEARFYRDSAGRTRNEQKLTAMGPWQTRGEPVTLITINDPVADVSYSLNTADQTALSFRPFKMAAGELGADERSVPSSTSGASAVPQTLPAPPPGVTTFTLRADPAAAGGRPPEPFELAVPPPPGAAGGNVAFRAIGPAVAIGGVSLAPGAGAVATEDLGEQVLEGVLARGTRHTQTIEAGAIGNERPIEIVAEEWFSPDLEAVVLRRNVDPRFGETVYRLINVARSEQPPDLFTVPNGYTIQGDGARAGIAATEQRDAGGRVERRVFLLQPKDAPQTR